MKKFYSVLFLALLSFVLFAQDNPYYKNKGIEGKNGAALKSALSDLIYSHHDVGYNGLYDVYETSDNQNGHVWDMYSTCNFSFGNKGGNSHVCSGYNREHMIPQSWFGKSQPMKSDAFHVYPTDCKVNGARSNYPHGETNAAPLSQNSSYGSHALGKVGSCTVKGFSGTVYEPVDEYKGDIARTYFYFVTCYEDKNITQNEPANAAFAKNGNTTDLKPWFRDMLLRWHYQDPVSQKEIDRNNAVYVHQKNRNPFIDYPALVDHIWGDKKDVAFSFDGSVTPDPNPNPNPDPDPQPQPEGFDVTELVSGLGSFTVFSVTGEQEWFWSEYKGKKYAKMSGFNQQAYANEDWLISPSYNLAGMQKATLTFDHILNFAEAKETQQTVWVTNDYAGGNPSSATWTELKGFMYPAGNSWDEVVKASVSLPESALGQNTRIAFKYTSTASTAATWEVFNFHLVADPSDAQLFTINVRSIDAESGVATGSGRYKSGTVVEIKAVPNVGYKFIRWEDGNVDNPRQIVVSGNADYVAYFEKDGTPVDTPEAKICNVVTSGSSIVIFGSNGSDITLRDLCGRILHHAVASSDSYTVSLTRQGIYLLTIDNYTTKVVIR